MNKLSQGEAKEFTSNMRKISQAGQLQDLKLEKILESILVF